MCDACGDVTSQAMCTMYTYHVHTPCTPNIYTHHAHPPPPQEAAAAEAGNDLGSRSARGNRLQQDAAVLAEESKARRAKYV